MSAFKGRVAVVTGAASGIGKALSLELAARGCRVVVADLNLKGAREVVGELGAERAIAVRCDVSKASNVQSVVNRARRQFGSLDFMFNNAGVAIVAEARDLSLRDWNRVLDINLKGVVNGTHAAYKVMLAQGSGHIVNVASGFGLVPGPGLIAYVTTKFGVVGLSDTLRAEAHDLGIKVTVVCPGFVNTPILASGADSMESGRALIQAPIITSERAATITLDGVARDRAIIAFPLYVRLAAWLYHRCPWLFFRFLLKGARDLRRSKQKSL